MTPLRKRKASTPQRPLPCVEALQPRTMLSVTPAMAARLEAAGFEKTTWKGQEVYVEPGEWIVSMNGLKGNEARRLAQARARFRGARGLSLVRGLAGDGLMKVSAPEGAGADQVSAALRRVRGAKLVEPNFAVWAQGVVNDARYGEQSNLNNTGSGGGILDADIDAPEAWDVGAAAGMQEVVVGVIDTGVDYTHPDLAASMWSNAGEVAGNGRDDDGNGWVDDVHGYDFAEDNGDPMDDHGHGTHVAGILAATPNNGIGIAGVAPNVKIMALRFLTADGFGTIEGAMDALRYAATMKSRGVNVRVTNNSWGGVEYSAALEQAVRTSGTNGILYVAASGNGGDDGVGDDNDVTPFYPSSLSAANLIAVSATTDRDALGGLSNYGATTVNLSAPGVSVLSTYKDHGYLFGTGTSMAAPHVSGVAAMAFGMAPAASVAEVRGVILGGVDVLPALAGKSTTGGRLNAAATLRKLLPPAVVGRHVFYNNSAFDGHDAAAGALDDAAIAPAKAALLPGETAGAANYTSYSRGINGVMVDLRNAAVTPGAEDFSFKMKGPGASWVDAPAANVAVRRGAGVDGSDRGTITFADGAIRDTWLRVTVLSNARTGLAAPDVFYFGNLVADTGNGAAAAVNALDVAATRAAMVGGPAVPDSRFDFNRDGVVNVSDLAVVRARQGSVLELIEV